MKDYGPAGLRDNATWDGAPHDHRSKADKVLEKHGRMVKEKQPWINTYKLVGEYVMSRKQNFNQDVGQGEILTGQIFDGTAGQANHMMASSLLGALYPYGARTFVITAPDLMPEDVKQQDDVKKWYKQVNDIMTNVMEDAQAGLRTALIEYMLDQGSFGISGIGVFETGNPDRPINYVAVDCKKITIAEGPNGFVDTVYIEYEKTIKQVIQEFGWAKVSKRTRERYEKGEGETMIKVLHAIEPRIDGAPSCFGTAGMPISSIHIEIEEKHELEESGFWDMPVFVTRFWKAMGEKYGRSPAMEAMPDILELNLFREASIVATEKMLDPPLAVNDPDILGGGSLNTSAGAVNVRKMGAGPGTQANRPAVEQIITVGEMNSTYTRIDVLTDNVKNAFFIKMLTELNTDRNRITATEVNDLKELRGQSLVTTYDRQMSELFTPVINRTFNILVNGKFFGVMPDSKAHYEALAREEDIPLIPEVIADMILAGRDVFKIQYISPAARIMQAEELQGIERTAMFAGNLMPVAPGVMDNLDVDQMVRRYSELSGAPPQIVTSMETMKKLRDAKQAQEQAMMELQTAQVGAATAKDAGAAVKSVAGAQAA